MVAMPLGATAALALALGSVLGGQPARGREPAAMPATLAAPPCQGIRIGARGIVEPAGGMIEIGTDQQGVILEVFVNSGDNVAAGDPILRLDDGLQRADQTRRAHEVRLAEARLAARAVERRRLAEAILAERMRLDGARLALREAEELRESAERLDENVSRRELARLTYAAARAQAKVLELEATLREREATFARLDSASRVGVVAVDRAEVARAQADLAAATEAVARRTVRAPRAGVVYQIAVAVGEAVGERPVALLGAEAPAQVVVELDELDFPRFAPELAATAARRGPGAPPIALTFVRLEPIVLAQGLGADPGVEAVDARVVRVVYQAEDTSLIPGETLDVLVSDCVDDRAAPPSVQVSDVGAIPVRMEP
jgi:multidrug efflux pump subunit AcrA (membrane-fusion protein)